MLAISKVKEAEEKVWSVTQKTQQSVFHSDLSAGKVKCPFDRKMSRGLKCDCQNLQRWERQIMCQRCYRVSARAILICARARLESVCDIRASDMSE